MTAETRAIEAPDLDQPLLVAEGLGKSYGRRIGCRDVDLTLYPGEVMAIVGESGSGKTTLLNLLSCRLEPSAGTVRYRMRDLGLSAIVVTHDLAVARLLSQRIMVMKDGRVIETGLTDQVLDDPREPYTQLLVASVLTP